MGQLRSEHEIGSLEVGKFADFVIPADDPMTVNADAIEEVSVLETWVGGKQVFNIDNR